MNTPICDFVRAYREKNIIRGHMPGHKGREILGMEPMDITEIQGADSLYEADGIIRESEKNASFLFGCPTFYSTEGSSQCIRAMVFLAMQWAGKQRKKPLIAAGRNVHKAFVTAAAMAGCDVEWLYPGEGESYLSCCPTAADAEAFLAETKPAALYLTSPDYLGHMADIEGIANACKKLGVLLMVDNAHGAYLRFLQPSLHPMDLGADICCDSAHKTLPVLTGGAYLHAREGMFSEKEIKNALSLFGSTSPSYLILQSLDAANPILAEPFPRMLSDTVSSLQLLKSYLQDVGYVLAGNEPMKLTVLAKPYGYTGFDMAQALREDGVECEFCDADHVVLMPGPMLDIGRETRLSQALLLLKRRPAIQAQPPRPFRPERVLSIRDAMFADSEWIPAERSEGRILSYVTVGCPPAVPIVVSGERIGREAVAAFRYFGIDSCHVVKE
ncbi:MAG: PLP-dependent transferase [Clostridia bacterium]|nr:PLP-dependent transferase [Clostridia bacterium]